MIAGQILKVRGMEDLTISVKNILVNEAVQSAEEIIRKLGRLLYNSGYVKDTYVQAVLDREEIFPTGLHIPSLGFAIPHTDAKHVNQSAVAVATLSKPVVFKAMDNPEVDIPVTMVMMLAISDPKKVIESLTKVISILEYETTIDKIKNATTKKEIRDAIREHMRRITEQRSASPSNFIMDH